MSKGIWKLEQNPFKKIGDGEAVNMQLVCSVKATIGEIELQLMNGKMVKAEGAYALKIAEQLDIDFVEGLTPLS